MKYCTLKQREWTFRVPSLDHEVARRIEARPSGNETVATGKIESLCSNGCSKIIRKMYSCNVSDAVARLKAGMPQTQFNLSLHQITARKAAHGFVQK